MSETEEINKNHMILGFCFVINGMYICKENPRDVWYTEL